MTPTKDKSRKREARSSEREGDVTREQILQQSFDDIAHEASIEAYKRAITRLYENNVVDPVTRAKRKYSKKTNDANRLFYKVADYVSSDQQLGEDIAEKISELLETIEAKSWLFIKALTGKKLRDLMKLFEFFDEAEKSLLDRFYNGRISSKELIELYSLMRDRAKEHMEYIEKFTGLGHPRGKMQEAPSVNIVNLGDQPTKELYSSLPKEVQNGLDSLFKKLIESGEDKKVSDEKAVINVKSKKTRKLPAKKKKISAKRSKSGTKGNTRKKSGN